MLKNKKKPKNNKESFFVHATLKGPNLDISNIPCKIYLPDYIDQKPFLEFRPTKEESYEILALNDGIFEAVLIGFDGNKEVSFYAPSTYFSDFQTNHWGKELTESSFSGHPQHLQVIRHFKNEHDLEKTLLTLWISPNLMLQPNMSRTSHDTGNIEYKRIPQPEFKISNTLTIKFDNHFKIEDLNKNELKQWSYLVACTELDIPANEVDKYRKKILPQIDDFLAIASFGSRTRTACLGWEAADNHNIVTYYRRNFSFPTGESEPGINDRLVMLKDFSQFMNVCYPAFKGYPNKKVIRDAIISVVSGRDKTIQGAFLSMFAGLESLILDFRRRENLEFVVSDENQWGKLKKEIKNSIKVVIEPLLDSKQRCFIYNKLNELNRISLQTAFDKFCLKYEVDLSDLWPVFKKDKVIGLSDIRNRLIHGDSLSSEFSNALWVASENLRFTIERILVSILGWPVDKTEVAKDFLKTHANAIKKMPEEQVKLSNYF